MALAKQFEGKELTFKSSTLIGMKNGAGTAWQRFKTGATSAKGAYSTGKGMYKSGQSIQSGVKLMQQGGRAAAHASASGDLTKQIMDFCKTLTPGMDPNKVFQHLNLGSVADFAGNLAPFLGAISSGKKMIMQWTGVARTAYSKHDTAQRRFAFKPGDPEAAFDAVLELLRRDIASQAAKAGVSTGAFTGKLLGAFADAGAVTGPVIGLLETLAEIFQIIVEYVKDYKEVEKANKIYLSSLPSSAAISCLSRITAPSSTLPWLTTAHRTSNWMQSAWLRRSTPCSTRLVPTYTTHVSRLLVLIR